MKNKIVLSILLILGIFSFADEEEKWKEAYNGENSYYFGENTWVDGSNAYSIGNDNYIYGNNNQVHGDKNKVGGENSRIDKNLVFGNNNEIYPDPVNKATREYKVFWAVELPSGQNVRGVRSIREGEKVKFNGSVDGAKLVWWNNDIEKPIKNNTIIFGRFIENDKTETKKEELHSKLSLLIDFTRDIVKESKKFLKSSDEEKEKILENVEEVVKRASNNHGKSESAMQSSINECEEILKRFTEEGPKQNDTPNVNITENKSKPDFIGNIIKGNDNLVIGQGNAVFGTNVHLGEKNKSSVNNNIILGSNITNTDVNNAIVIGNGSKAIENAVSIGNGGTTRQIKYVKAGTDDTDAVNVSQLKAYVAANSSSGGGAISYVLKDGNEQIKELKYENGKWKNKDGNEQQPNETKGEIVLQPAVKKVLTNISDGKIEENSTDVITGGQLYKNYYTKAEVDKKLEGINTKSDLALSGVANAVAMANLPQVSGDRKFNLAASYGYYGGSHAVAVGLSGTNDKQNFTYKLSGAVNSKGNLAFGIGAGVMLGSVNKGPNFEERLNKLEKENQELKEVIKKLMNK